MKCETIWKKMCHMYFLKTHQLPACINFGFANEKDYTSRIWLKLCKNKIQDEKNNEFLIVWKNHSASLSTVAITEARISSDRHSRRVSYAELGQRRVTYIVFPFASENRAWPPRAVFATTGHGNSVSQWESDFLVDCAVRWRMNNRTRRTGPRPPGHQKFIPFVLPE